MPDLYQIPGFYGPFDGEMVMPETKTWAQRFELCQREPTKKDGLLVWGVWDNDAGWCTHSFQTEDSARRALSMLQRWLAGGRTYRIREMRGGAEEGWEIVVTPVGKHAAVLDA